ACLSVPAAADLPRASAELPFDSGLALSLDLLQAFREPPGVGLLRLRQRLEPLRDLRETLLARLLGEARIHLRVLVRLACDGGLQVLLGIADRFAGGRIAHLLEVLEMAMGVAGLAFRRIAEKAGKVRTAFHVRLLGEVQIATVRLALA